MTDYIITPPQVTALPVDGTSARFPVRRVFCIGRNYADHAIEMGHDPNREDPFYFLKSAECLVSDGRFPYPNSSAEVHHEVELAVALKSGGTDIEEADAMSHVWGYAVALDMTRRDLQGVAKKLGRPWEIGKSFPAAAPIGPLSQQAPKADAAITLTINGDIRQSGTLNQLIWSLPELIAHLSRFDALAAGDIILTGTPAGVGPVQRGDSLQAQIAGLPPLAVEVY